MRSVIDTLRKETEWHLLNAKLKPQKSERVEDKSRKKDQKQEIESTNTHGRY